MLLLYVFFYLVEWQDALIRGNYNGKTLEGNFIQIIQREKVCLVLNALNLLHHSQTPLSASFIHHSTASPEFSQISQFNWLECAGVSSDTKRSLT